MVETEKTTQTEMSTQAPLSLIQDKLIKLLKRNGPMTRKQICEAFGFEQIEYTYTRKYTQTGTLLEWPYYQRKFMQYKKTTTIYDNLDKLIQRKILEKYSSKPNGKRGRPVVLFKLKS
ncbi:MAG: hypothetical protein ACFFDN_00040 [Candidatus Hodarchaeota archaeon]